MSSTTRSPPPPGCLISKVLRAHLLCAAAECPLGVPAMGGVTDAALFGGEERLAEVSHVDPCYGAWTTFIML